MLVLQLTLAVKILLTLTLWSVQAMARFGADGFLTARLMG